MPLENGITIITGKTRVMVLLNHSLGLFSASVISKKASRDLK